MAQAPKPDFVFRRNGRVHLNRQGRQFSRLLAAEVCASAVVMLDTPRSEVVWRVLATYSLRQFPLHFPSRASPCAITFKTQSTILYLRVLSRGDLYLYNGYSVTAKRYRPRYSAPALDSIVILTFFSLFTVSVLNQLVQLTRERTQQRFALVKFY